MDKSNSAKQLQIFINIINIIGKDVPGKTARMYVYLFRYKMITYYCLYYIEE